MSLHTLRAFVLLLLLLGCSARPAPKTTDAGVHFPRADALGVVVLVPGVGTDARVFDLPGASLARSLWNAGYEVRVLRDHHAVAPALRAATRAGLPLYAVGLDLGGTAAYLAAPEVPALTGVVGIGAPVAFGGATRACAPMERAHNVDGGMGQDESDHRSDSAGANARENARAQRQARRVGGRIRSSRAGAATRSGVGGRVDRQPLTDGCALAMKHLEPSDSVDPLVASNGHRFLVDAAEMHACVNTEG